jgi:prepilin-type N-terminal cleavage/methylation domain-containing protein
MNRTHPSRRDGFTLIEIVIACALLAVVVGGVTSSFWTVQAAFDEERAEAELLFRSRAAMDRLSRLTSNAVTRDAAFALLPIAAGATPWGLRFREIDSVVAGNAVYDDLLVVHLIGPNAGGAPCAGVIVGRGPDLGAIWVAGRGADSTLGTADDDVGAELGAGTPAVEILIPQEFAPQIGQMLEFSTAGSPSGRLVTITLRTNFQRPDGTWLLAQDHVFTERVALRW